MRTPISLDDLPRFSAWPAVLLGAKPFPARQRTKKEVLREYDREKWGKVLAWLKNQTDCSPSELLRQQGLEPEKLIAYSHGAEFFTAPAGQVVASYEEILLSVLRRHRRDTLVELGSGLGDKLLKFAPQLQPRAVYGGEFTASGVECGRILAARQKTEATFGPFDYTNPATLESVPSGALVYTSHSIEQIPTLSESFVEGLLRRSPQCVIHFEPCYEDHADTSLIGLMRRRYAELNDYNRNLAGLLRSFEARGKLRIVEHEKEFFGISPFNVTSLIVWAPR